MLQEELLQRLFLLTSLVHNMNRTLQYQNLIFLESATKTIHFFKDELIEENYIGDSIIKNDKFSLTNNITKYEEVKAFIQISKKDFLWKSDVFELKFKQSLNIELKDECEHVLEESFEKKKEDGYCGDKIMICTKCQKEISRTPIEHDYIEQVEFANIEDVCTRTTKTCKNCEEVEIIETPHPGFHIKEEGIFDDVYGCDVEECPYEYVEMKNLGK